MLRNFLTASLRGIDHKFMSVRFKHLPIQQKWKGRLEYLNRGDPFADKRPKNQSEEKENIIFDKKDISSRKPRAYIWGNGEHGALGQLGFLHPSGNRNKLLTLKRPFISSLGNYYDIKSIACGYGFTLFLTNDKEKYLFGTGLNHMGQLGYQRKLDDKGRQKGKTLETVIVPSAIKLPLGVNEKVTEVSAGRTHCLALTNRGRVLSWGNNAAGQCGRPVIHEEDYINNQVVHVMDIDNIQRIECGQDHSLLVNSSGEVFSCGWGADGQTGLGHYNSTGVVSQLSGDIKGEKIMKVSCAGDCVLALSDSGNVFCWGNSEYQQLSMVTSEQQVCVPTHLPLKDVGKVVDIASGGTVCLVLNDVGQVWVWGYGILGKGPKLDSSSCPTPIPDSIFGQNVFGRESKVVKIFAGLGHQAAVTKHGDLFTWGKNRNACLGLNTEDDRFFPMKVPIGGKVSHVSLGVDHSAVLVKPWMS